jgi:hypothetical protein
LISVDQSAEIKPLRSPIWLGYSVGRLMIDYHAAGENIFRDLLKTLGIQDSGIAFIRLMNRIKGILFEST